MSAHEPGGGDHSANDLSRRVRALDASPTVGMAQRAAALRAKGEEILDFSVGEPDLPPPAQVTAATIAALEAGKTRYTNPAGIPRRCPGRSRVLSPPAECSFQLGGSSPIALRST